MNRMMCPLNEFSEHCTGDFGDGKRVGSDDTMLYYIANPEKSQFPEAAQRQQDWWKKYREENFHG
jgi:hypothetical protein